MLIEEQILCVVNGQSMFIGIHRHSHALLINLKGYLLCKLDYQSSNPEQWEFRDESGKLLPDALFLKDCNIPVEGKLYLTMKPGVGA